MLLQSLNEQKKSPSGGGGGRGRYVTEGPSVDQCCLDQGGHGTGKTGNLAVNFSRQVKHREFSKFNFLHRENFEILEFLENFVIKVATM